MPLPIHKLIRILFVIPAIGSVYGGPSKTVIELAQAIHREGVTVDIVTTNANGSEYLDIPLHQWLIKPEYRIQYFPYISLGDYKWSSRFANWLFHNVQNYDLVHSNAIFSLPNLPAHWACQWHNVPYLVTPHGMLEPWALSYKAWKKKLYSALLERPALNRASAIQALASPEAESIRKLGLKPPILIIPNGIHRQDFDLLPDPELFFQHFPQTRNKNLILFLGRIDPKKGLDLLAPAFAQALVQFPNIHLIVAGPDNLGYLPIAQRYFHAVNCLHAITFTGMLSGDLKKSALAAAQLYVAPSYSEGFSMSVLEGMASSLPCVITTGCNFPEAAEAQAAKVVDIDASAIAQALLELLADRDAAKAMGSRARQFIFENYTWDRVAANLISAYQQILDKPTIQ